MAAAVCAFMVTVVTVVTVMTVEKNDDHGLKGRSKRTAGQTAVSPIQLVSRELRVVNISGLSFAKELGKRNEMPQYPLEPQPQPHGCRVVVLLFVTGGSRGQAGNHKGKPVARRTQTSAST